MKRNTAVAILYWLILISIVFALGSVRSSDPKILAVLGATYVLLSWCPLLIVKYFEHNPVAESLGLRLKSPLRAVLWGLGSFALVSVFFVTETWYRIFLHGEALESAAQPITNLPFEILSQILWIGFPEEIINRGYLLSRLRESFGTSPALIVSSVFFGAGHLALGDLPRAIQAGLSGLVYGFAFLKTDSVYAPALAHISQNLFSSAIAKTILMR